MNTNNWNEIEKGNPMRKAGTGSIYDKYASLLVIVVSQSKSGYAYLMPNVCKALNEPHFIKIFSRGTNLALSASSDGGYTVQKGKGDKYKKVQLKKIVKMFDLKPGAYQCHIENESMIVFDSAEIPSKP